MPRNPYIDDESPLPPEPPGPVPKRPGWVSQWLVLAVAVAGLFLPSVDGCSFERLPIPIPAPGPDAEQTEGSWVIAIEETEDRTPAVAKVLGDLKWWRTLESRGLNWRHYDDDADEAQSYLGYVQPPGLIVLGGKPPIAGKVLHSGPLPSSVDELDAVVKEATGR